VSLGIDKSSWRRVTFGDVVRNVNETVKDPAAVGIDRVIAMEHMDPGELKIDRWGAAADGTTFTRRVRPGQTLFGKRRAYQRKVAYAEFDAICSGDIYTFEADETRMLGEFLPFLTQSDLFFDHALNTSAGSLSPGTNWRDLASLEFSLPPLIEQRRISDVLWALERHQTALKARQGLLTEVEAESRARAFESAAEKHGVVSVADVASIASGAAFPHKYQGKSHGDHPFLKVSDLGDEDEVTNAANWVTSQTASQMRAKVWPRGTVIFPKVGAALLSERRRVLGVDACFDNNVMGLVPGPAVSPAFLLAFMKTINLSELAQVGVIPSVNNGHIRSLQIPLLERADQALLLDRLAADFDAVVASSSEQLALTSLRSSILVEVFGGN